MRPVQAATASPRKQRAAPATNVAPRPAGPFEFEHERLVISRGPRSGERLMIAIHSTALGPALGGLRMWNYDSTDAAVADVLRLARGMTLKAAAAGLELGGGKGVICSPVAAEALSPTLRRGILEDFGDLVESLGGSYITAEDVGTNADDMVAIATRTAHVTGLPAAEGGVGDPSPFTAVGVEAAIRACVQARFGSSELRGLGVVVVGLGHVGARLATRLAAAGARLTVADTDPRKHELAARLGARWVEPSEAISSECDVLAPCALGGMVSRAKLGSIRAAIICGAANNQLADDGVAALLAEAGVLYGPDFIANSGGLISCYRELHGLGSDRALAMSMGIERTMGQVLAAAETRTITPLDAAIELARERLDGAVRD